MRPASYDACAQLPPSILGATMFWIFIAIVWVIAVGVGAWLIFHSYPDPDRIDVKRQPYRIPGLLTVGAASAIFVLATVFFSFAQVNAGHVGVVRTFGRISGQIEPGVSLIAPWQTYDSVNVQVQKETFTNLTAFSAETQNVLITTTINYSIAPQDARGLIARVGTDWFLRLVPNNLNQAFKDEVVKFAAVEIAPNREPIRTAVLRALRERLAPYSVRINDLNIDNIAFSRQFEQAIEAKQEATQAALKAKAQVQQAQFEAQSRVAKAKGEADANVTVALGQAEANRKLNASLSANVLQYIAIQKLSPLLRIAVLPSGSGTLIDPTKLLGGTTNATGK
jgi:regulator of protease activity HflC (stomatin/prohibitin superfamily)